MNLVSQTRRPHRSATDQKPRSARLRSPSRSHLRLEALEPRTLLSFTPISLPDSTYTGSTTKIEITTPDGSTTTSITDGTETVTFSQTMTAATIGNGWSNWGDPPNTESST